MTESHTFRRTSPHDEPRDAEGPEDLVQVADGHVWAGSNPASLQRVDSKPGLAAFMEENGYLLAKLQDKDAEIGRLLVLLEDVYWSYGKPEWKEGSTHDEVMEWVLATLNNNGIHPENDE